MSSAGKDEAEVGQSNGLVSPCCRPVWHLLLAKTVIPRRKEERNMTFLTLYFTHKIEVFTMSGLENASFMKGINTIILASLRTVKRHTKLSNF